METGLLTAADCFFTFGSDCRQYSACVGGRGGVFYGGKLLVLGVQRRFLALGSTEAALHDDWSMAANVPLTQSIA